MSSTVSLRVTDAEYLDVSEGSSNCVMMVTGSQTLRIHVGISQPPPDTLDFAQVMGPKDSSGRSNALSIVGMTGQDALWVRAGAGSADVVVIRGSVEIITTVV